MRPDSLAGVCGHVAPSLSSAFGAPPLRFGRFAVTASSRHGVWLPRASTPQTGALRPVCAPKLSVTTSSARHRVSAPQPKS
jgi:hypothetical protein